MATPNDITRFVAKAIKLTNPWHKRQKHLIKQWWRFW
jgi:hypothetical protein